MNPDGAKKILKDYREMLTRRDILSPTDTAMIDALEAIMELPSEAPIYFSQEKGYGYLIVRREMQELIEEKLRSAE